MFSFRKLLISNLLLSSETVFHLFSLNQTIYYSSMHFTTTCNIILFMKCNHRTSETLSFRKPKATGTLMWHNVNKLLYVNWPSKNLFKISFQQRKILSSPYEMLDSFLYLRYPSKIALNMTQPVQCDQYVFLSSFKSGTLLNGSSSFDLSGLSPSFTNQGPLCMLVWLFHSQSGSSHNLWVIS